MGPGDEIAGRYRLEELVGRGPMSEVWRAHDATLDRTVALKLLAATADVERFRREARAVASLGHENVMRVYDYGEDAAGPFMALEWLPGGTLETRLANGALGPVEAENVTRGIAAGLAHLHERGVVHRDLKPANVMFDDEGRLKLADFGLARGAAGAGTLTEAGTVLGTAAYISPEQAAGEGATPASDVYSLGVLLFRMLTGVLPFIADDAMALVEMHLHEPAPLVESVNPNVPPELAALTNAALAKDPAARPADGAAVLAALGAVPTAAALADDSSPTTVLPAVAPPRAGPSRRSLVAIALSVLLLAGLGGVLAWAVTRPAPTAPPGIVSTQGSGRHRPTTQSTPTTTGTGTRTRSTTTATTASSPTTTAHTTTAHTTTAHTTTSAPTTAQTTTTIPATTTTPTTTTPPTTTAPSPPATTTTAVTT